MKKRYNKYIVLIISILIVLVTLLFIINNFNENKKIIFYSYSKVYGFIVTENKITIDDEGTIVVTYKSNEENVYKTKLSKDELSKIKQIIMNIENSKLYIKEDRITDGYIDESGEKYIDINKKIILKDNNISYTNEHIEELYKNIQEIEQNILNKEG